MFGRKNKRKEKDKEKSKKQDIVDEGDSEALRLLRANISNYYGYKNKDVRQSSDIAFREHLLELLRNASDGMSKVHELLIHSQLITTWGLVGEIKKKLEKLRREVANTDYHKSTFFDIDDVEGPNGIDLSILYLLEIEILDIAVDLKERVAKANTNLEEMMLENAEDDVKILSSIVNSFEQTLSDRNELIRAFEKMVL
ncbi:MAG: hypothetical protein K9W46_05685 [Candidatus Heimdallarchaeum endolithica]|uniref:Uncharacterized protein n=1 Tax=Candidatus Heimdallarchaeum endolithica TaxID=2876572 RepID=A0A9Y1FQH9_9ARCH|nr:MAG: hypothetical protein K9W46_05685 [Candidatus Heimdallarchaeum endolithica]